MSRFQLVIMQGGVEEVVDAIPEDEARIWLSKKIESHERHGWRVVRDSESFKAEKRVPRGLKERTVLIRRVG